MTPHEFLLEVNGKCFDLDGAYGAQCWDGYAYYMKRLGYAYANCTTSGYVKDIWNNRVTNGMLKSCIEVPVNQMQDGDIAVWGNCAHYPYSHIAIFRKHNEGTNAGIFLGQNQGGVNGAFNQKNLYYDGLIGAFRPKCFIVSQAKIKYRAHIQNSGWQSFVRDGEIAGTTGAGLRLEGIQLDTAYQITAKGHIENIGWRDYGKITKDTLIGTAGEGKRLEAICLHCLNARMVYRVHIEECGWSAWTLADGVATLGTVGLAKRLEAIQIVIE